MDIIETPGAKAGSIPTSWRSGRAILRASTTNDFVLCNIKGGGHRGPRGDAFAKVEFVQKVDNE